VLRTGASSAHCSCGPRDAVGSLRHSCTNQQAVRLLPMRSTLVVFFSLICFHLVVAHKLRKRSSRGNSSAFGLGEFDSVGSGLDDAHLSGLTDSIEGLFKGGGQETGQEDAHMAGLSTSIEGLFNSSGQESVGKPRAPEAHAARQPTSTKPSIALPAKKALTSSRNGVASAAKPKAAPPQKADLHAAMKIAERAAQDAKVLASKAAHTKAVSKKLSQKKHEAHPPVPHVKSTMPKLKAQLAKPTARKHEPTITAMHTALNPKPASARPVARKPQNASAIVRAASPTSAQAKVSKPSLEKVVATGKKLSNSSVAQATNNTPASMGKATFSTRNHATELSSKKAPAAKRSSSESSANMSSIAEGAKNSPLRAKKAAVGTFAVDPASNPLRINVSNFNISNVTRNSSVAVDSEVVHELPMAKLALGDDDDASSAKSNASGNSSGNASVNSTNRFASTGVRAVGSKNITANNSQWPAREKYLESQIAALKQKLQNQASDRSGTSLSPAANPVKKVKSAIETSAAVFSGQTSASDDEESSSSDDSQAETSDDSVASTSVSFNIGETGSALYFKKKPFAVGTFTQAPSDVTAHPAWGSQSMSFWGWISSFFGGSSTTAMPTLRGGPNVKVSSLLTVESQGHKQNAERTARATADDSMHSVSLGDPWTELEKEDDSQEDLLRHKDVVARIVAHRADAPHKPTKAELESRHQTDISSFWGSLEQEDRSIERSLSENGDDLEQYERLTQFQNERVNQAQAVLEQDNLNFDGRVRLKKADNSFEATPIHDVFEHLEKHDQKTEKQIKSNPDLQMLQLGNKRRNA